MKTERKGERKKKRERDQMKEKRIETTKKCIKKPEAC